MRRTAALIVGVATALALTTGTALAENVHFKGEPSFTDNGTTLTTSGTLTGLGNKDITVTVKAEGVASKIICTNPGGNQAPGQNKPRVNTSGSQFIDSSDFDKNGNVRFSVTTGLPANPSAKAAGCPNNNWKATILDVTFTSATITVTQADGTVVLNKTYQL